MTTDRRDAVALGALLSAVAGGVDVLAFVGMGGAFSSIVTGNLIVGGLSVGRGDWATVARVLTAVAAYTVGVAAGTALTRRNPGRLAMLCGIELALVVALLALWVTADARLVSWQPFAGLVAAGLAMGVQSAAFRLVALPAVTTTYLTGTLTSLVAGLVHDRRTNVPALVSLAALLAAAIVTGLVIVHAAVFAAVVPAALLVVAVVLAHRRSV